MDNCGYLSVDPRSADAAPTWTTYSTPTHLPFVATVTVRLTEYDGLRAERDMLAERVDELEDRIAASLSALCPDGDEDDEEGDEV